MGKQLGNFLKNARTDRKLTQSDVASYVGVSRVAVGQWESGQTEPSRGNLRRLCSLYALDYDKVFLLLSSGERETSELPTLEEYSKPKTGVFELVERKPKHDVSSRPYDANALRTVPVYLTEFAGDEADFIRQTHVIDAVRRPPSFSGSAMAEKLYALYVPSPALSPRYEEGELMYVWPTRHPGPNDYVLIRLVDDTDDGRERWIMRRFEGRRGNKILLRRLNPESTQELDVAEVKALHRIVGWGELMEA